MTLVGTNTIYLDHIVVMCTATVTKLFSFLKHLAPIITQKELFSSTCITYSSGWIQDKYSHTYLSAEIDIYFCYQPLTRVCSVISTVVITQIIWYSTAWDSHTAVHEILINIEHLCWDHSLLDISQVRVQVRVLILKCEQGYDASTCTSRIWQQLQWDAIYQLFSLGL